MKIYCMNLSLRKNVEFLKFGMHLNIGVLILVIFLIKKSDAKYPKKNFPCRLRFVQ